MQVHGRCQVRRWRASAERRSRGAEAQAGPRAVFRSASGPTRGLPFRFAGSAGMRRRYVLRRPGAVSSRLPGPVRGDCAVPAIRGHVETPDRRGAVVGSALLSTDYRTREPFAERLHRARARGSPASALVRRAPGSPALEYVPASPSARARPLTGLSPAPHPALKSRAQVRTPPRYSSLPFSTHWPRLLAPRLRRALKPGTSLR